MISNDAKMFFDKIQHFHDKTTQQTRNESKLPQHDRSHIYEKPKDNITVK